MKEDLKAWCQQHHCEALAQLAVHEGSRETLLRDGSVVPALESVAASGLTQAARELASAALTALSDKKLVMVAEGQKHIMLSCESAGAFVYNPIRRYRFTRMLVWCMQTSGTIRLNFSG